MLLSPRRWRLATRVTVAVVLLLVPLLIVELFNYRQAADERRRAEIENAAVVANTVATVVDGFGRDIEGTFLAAALGIGARPGQLDQAALGPLLDRLAQQYAVMRAIFVTDLSGRVVASQQASGVGVNLAGRAYVEALRAGAEAYWSDGFAGSESGEITVAFARTIPGPDGAARGFLIAAFYPPSLLERRFALVLPPDSDVTFVDRNGLVLHSTARGPLPAADRDGAAAPRMAEALAGRTVLVADDATPFGSEPRYGALVPVPRVGWIVAFTRPRAMLDAALQGRLLEQAALALITRRLVRPLTQLADTAAAIARGERPAVPDPAGDPEVVQLVGAMSVMSRAVAEREDALGRALTEARRAGEGLRRQNERAALLADASASLAAASTNLPPALEAVTLHVADKLGDGCVVLLRGPGERGLEIAALYHRAIEPHQVARELVDEAIRADAEIVRRVFERGQPLLAARSDPDQARALFGAGHARYASLFAFSALAAVPVRIAERTVGALAVWRDVTERPFDLDDQTVLQDLAERIGLAVENAGLYEAAQEQASTQLMLNTALREAAEERDHALAAAEDAMRARDEFLASASHDLKNPLVTIKGAAQIAQRLIARQGEIDHARLNALLGSIDAAATRLTAQIQELLDVARMRVGHPLELNRRHVDLIELVRAAASEYQETTESHQIRVESEEPELRGEWDPRRLQRMLGNLLSNAIKYSPRGGEITVTVQRQREGVLLRVADHGLGIPAESRPHVFDPFRRGQNVGQIAGTGLGLAGVKAIVEEHGGTVEVESEEGIGSTFTVWLPLAA
jgi:signal transduction histidine kinase